MTLKEEIPGILSELKPNHDKTKAILEHNKSAKAFSLILGEEKGVELIEYISEELNKGKMPLYSLNRFIGRSEFQRLIETFYNEKNDDVLNILLPAYHQLWLDDEDSAKAIFELLKKLETSPARRTVEFVLCVCLECHTFSTTNEGDMCNGCGVDNLMRIYAVQLSDSAKDVLKNGQFLEIYAKHCLKKSGIELIGWDNDKKHSICTSISYQIEGEDIEIDVHGITDPIGLLLCECKTSNKITMNELRRVESIYNRLTNKIADLLGRTISYPKVFVITGGFDSNIPIGSYRRKEWILLDRSKIQNLSDEFNKILQEL
ncbi:MAG: hypothetical protein SVM80_06285 [Halobacteriota archaeon]|nr:hypothetical protein [Halobacteriota archaeon]